MHEAGPRGAARRLIDHAPGRVHEETPRTEATAAELATDLIRREPHRAQGLRRGHRTRIIMRWEDAAPRLIPTGLLRGPAPTPPA